VKSALLLLLIAATSSGSFAADAPQSADCAWRGMARSTSGFRQYRVVKVARDRCEWRRDRLSEREFARREHSRRDLFHALKTRVLTDDELRRVAEYGTSINVEYMTQYSEETKAAELQAALRMQMILQARQGRAEK